MSKEHTHKYQKKNLTRTPGKEPFIVFACALPGCTHYIRREFIIGKASICNRCGQPFIIKYRSSVEAKPHCDSCVKHTKAKAKILNEIDELIKELEIPLE